MSCEMGKTEVNWLGLANQIYSKARIHDVIVKAITNSLQAGASKVDIYLQYAEDMIGDRFLDNSYRVLKDNDIHKRQWEINPS